MSVSIRISSEDTAEIIVQYGPSGEIRTPGIRNPNASGILFLVLSGIFGGIQSEK